MAISNTECSSGTVRSKTASCICKSPHRGPPAPTAGTIDSRTVQIAGEQEAIVSLFQPPMEGNSNMEVGVEGVSQSKTMIVGSIAPGGYYRGGPVSGAKSAVLLSRAVPQDFHQSPAAGFHTAKGLPAPSPAPHTLRPLRRNRRVWASPTYPGTSPSPEPPEPEASKFTFLRSELPASQWSPNWLGYSCYDVVLLTAKEAEQMPAEAQLALRRFLECGGTLLVHGPKVPAAFSQSAMADDHGGYFVGLGHAVASGAESETNWEKAARAAGRPAALPTPTTHQKPADSHNLWSPRPGARARDVRPRAAVRRRHRAGECLAPLPLQAADLAVVERAGHLLADLPGRVRLFGVFRRLDGPRQDRQHDPARPAHAPRDDLRLRLLLSAR